MKILLTGANGLLGQKIITQAGKRQDIELIATGKGPYRGPALQNIKYLQLDITSEEDVAFAIEKERPEVVIHGAAMTNVDACETERETAWDTNVNATRYIALACAKNNVHLVFVSTDFIFDGEDGPYNEEAAPNPISYYGKTKLEAEKIVMESKATWAILRTVLVYGVTPGMSRSNIVLWARNALLKGDPINVVTDQFRSPTLAEDLAEGCLLAATHRAKGIYHISGDEVMSIFELVQRVADFFGLDKALIRPSTSDNLNQPAKRPPVTGFIIEKARQELDYKPHSFEEGLALVKEQMQIQ